VVSAPAEVVEDGAEAPLAAEVSPVAAPKAVAVASGASPVVAELAPFAFEPPPVLAEVAPFAFEPPPVLAEVAPFVAEPPPMAAPEADSVAAAEPVEDAPDAVPVVGADPPGTAPDAPPTADPDALDDPTNELLGCAPLPGASCAVRSGAFATAAGRSPAPEAVAFSSSPLNALPTATPATGPPVTATSAATESPRDGSSIPFVAAAASRRARERASDSAHSSWLARSLSTSPSPVGRVDACEVS